MSVLTLFFCSGVTALIYEVIWSKYLALVLGSTVHAQTVVLAVFMGGLALGNRLFGRRADQARQPLALFGYLEVAIGLFAFFFEHFYKLADRAFVGAGVMLLGHSALMLLLKISLSAALLLVPTVLMGGTLPTLAAWLQRPAPDAGRRAARLYSLNCLGAVIGAWLAGFYLVQWMGLASTLQMTALFNVLIGFAAVGLARGSGEKPSLQPPTPDWQEQVETENVALPWACLLVALTGAVSLGLEVLAARALALVFGASLQSFALVLMAFILGIGAGSAVVASPRLRLVRRERSTHVLLIAAACLIGILLSHIEELVEVYQVLQTGFARSEMGYRFHQLLAGGIALLFLGVPAGLLGAVLPLWMRAESGGPATLGERVGRLLKWNTLGAVAGALLTGFVLMPYVGLRGSFGVLAIVLCLAAMPTAFASQRPRPILVSAGVVALLVIACQTGGEGWRHIMSSGIFRSRETEASPVALEARRKYIKILFYEDAADATVSVEQGDGVVASGELKLRINGKVDASSHTDLATQYLLAHLPMLARPESKEVFVLGLGSGITVGALLGHPVKHVDVAENCAPVVRAAKFFEPHNRGVLTNELVKIWREDARTLLKLTPRRYDVIISEPSNPWMAGVGSVFSREFYELAASRLQEGGMMAQWFHVYEMNDGIVAMVLRTFAQVFPFVEVWDSGLGDIILLGSNRPWESSVEAWQRFFAREQPRYDLQKIGLRTPEMVWARQLASLRTAFAIAGEGPIQTDGFPVLEYEAPRAFYLGSVARALSQYDERTWQANLAPPEKRAALASLDRDTLGAIFTEHGTANGDLERYVRLRLRTAQDPGLVEVFVGSYFMRTAFQSAGRWPELPPQTGGKEDEWLQLLRAEALIQTTPDQWQQGVAAMETVLRAYQPQREGPAPLWTPGHFIALAARTCLAHGELETAKQLLALGLELEPYEQELGYLVRLLMRQLGASAAATPVKE